MIAEKELKYNQNIRSMLRLGESFLLKKNPIITVKYKCLLTVFFVFVMFAGNAQESMLHEVNYQLLQRLIDTAKAKYPNIRAFEHRINIANENLKKAKLSWFDVLTFSMSYSPTQTTTIVAPTLTGFQVGVYFNVGSLIVKPNNIRQAKEEMKITYLNKEQELLSIEAQVKTRYFIYVKALTTLKLQSQMVLDDDGLLKQVKYKFEKGEENFESYTKALLSLSKSRQDVIETEGLMLIAKANLEELIDKKLEDFH